MIQKIASVEISGLFAYLCMRVKLRFTGGRGFALNAEEGENDWLINLDLNDLEQKYLFADCVREPENLIVYRALSASKLATNFVDIGANCGHVALSILNSYENILLFEPNPTLANLLRIIFQDSTHVKIKECAIVDHESVGTLVLSVPTDSSGLATLGGTLLSAQRPDINVYSVNALTLESQIDDMFLSKAYIKIDVEGFEENIIRSIHRVIVNQRPIVGFEALSLSLALNCSSYFKDYSFYCSRFDFLEDGGALSNSKMGIIFALLSGANIEILKLDKLEAVGLRNFSQIYAVPNEKSELFERSVSDYVGDHPVIELDNLRTWSARPVL